MWRNFVGKISVSWLAFVAAWMLSLSFVLSIGAQIQIFVVSLLNSDFPSVYESAYQHNLIAFPSLSEWIGGARNWLTLAMSVIVAWAISRKSDPRAIAWNVAFIGFFVLTLFDMGVGFFGGQLTVKWIFENIAANTIGSIVLAVLVVLICLVGDFFYVYLPIRPQGRRYFALLIVMVGGVVYSCVAYYICEFLYHPLPVRFDAYFSAPASGFVTTDKSSLVDSDKSKLFSFIPEETISANASWISPKGKLLIKALASVKEFPRISIALLSDCVSPEEVRKLKAMPHPWVDVSNAGSFEVSADGGQTDFGTLFGVHQKAKIEFKSDPLLMFSIDQDSGTKNLKFSHFVSGGAHVDLQSVSDDVSFWLSVPLVEVGGEKMTLASRTITLRIGSATKLLRFDPPGNVSKMRAKSKCSVVNVPALRSGEYSGLIRVPSVGAIAGVLVKLTHGADNDHLSMANIGIRVSGPDGWVQFTDLRPDQIGHRSLGNLGALQIRGNISDLRINDAPMVVHQIEAYTALGDLSAAYGDKGDIRVWGQAKRLWKDQGRLNPTKWEQLGWEVKLFLIGLVGAVAAFLGPIVAKRFRTNAAFGWFV